MRITLASSHHTPRPLIQSAAATLTQISRRFHLWLCIATCTLLACQTESLDTSATQRSLGELSSLELGVSVQLAPGVMRSLDADSGRGEGRLTAGLGQLTLRTSEAVASELTMTLKNIHRDAIILPRRVRRFTPEGTLDGACPAREANLNVTCVGSERNAFCGATATTRGAESTATFTLPVAPCRETVYEIILPAAIEAEPLSAVIVGAMPSPQTLREIDQAERELGHSHDLYVVLGDALQGGQRARLGELEEAIAGIDQVVVALPGEQEMGADDGQRFEQSFGAFDVRWTFKEVQWVAFYSARGTLSARGLASLESLLRAMEVEDQRWRNANTITLAENEARALPALAVTHTPPFDPSGPRGAGFKSSLQASQVMSLLADYGVHTLFAGRLFDNAHVTSRPELRVTTAQNTRVSRDKAQYLRITLSREPSPGSTPLGIRHMIVEAVPLPQE